ncbi:MAG TPA: Wzz/FepE/Etk N-terminal domain-containing protein [Ktedonobacteraceae bacterium]|nr:Wzz/FepE/Etk N-terminal domain-containing protein [Ktedonobacteraceae bacterium]
MTFEQYWSMLVKRWKLALACFLLVGLGAYVVSRLMTPLYQSSVIVQVVIHSGSNQSDINNLLASDQLVQTEAQLAVSGPVLRAVASHHPGLTIEQLGNEVSSVPKTNTQLFEITVLDARPEQAASIANDIAATLIALQLQARQQDDKEAQQQIQQDLDTTRQRIQATGTQLDNARAHGGTQEQIAYLSEQLNSLGQHYTQWQSALAQLELAEAQSSNFLRVVQPAQPGHHPVRPNILLNSVAGLSTGLLLALLLVVLLEKLDKRVRTPEVITQLVDWPILATVWHEQAQNGVSLVNPTGRNINVEAYRLLRTNIGFSSVDKPLRFLMVTSATPREGKSTIAANLAIFMAKAGKNTLLVDADLRRPTLHEKFGLPADKMGLSNAILTSGMPVSYTPSQFARHTSAMSTPVMALDAFIHTVGIPNLRLMPSGPLPPNPSELLDSKAMQRLFEAFEHCGAEVVILDVPPLLGISDSSILASKVDGAIIVVDTNRASKSHLREMQTVLVQAGAHIVGCVLNNMRGNRKNSPYAYYYDSYRTDAAGSDTLLPYRKQSVKGAKATPAMSASIPRTTPRTVSVTISESDNEKRSE